MSFLFFVNGKCSLFLLCFTEYPTPRLICPPNQLLELAENGNNKVQVKLQKPKTDVNFKRDITIKPSWIKHEKITLGIGEQNITYTAKHPVSKLTVSCTTSIFVVGKLTLLCLLLVFMFFFISLLKVLRVFFCPFKKPLKFFMKLLF